MGPSETDPTLERLAVGLRAADADGEAEFGGEGGFGVEGEVGFLRAVRVGDWKLVAAKGDPWELYNLTEDRAEQTNLSAQMPDKVRELEAIWQKQTDSFTALAKLTASPQTNQGAKGKKKTKT